VRRLLTGIASTALLGVVTIVPTGEAQAVQAPHSVVVNDNPENFTPHVLDGEVRAVAEVGNMMVLGGEFTQVSAAADGSPVLDRSNIVAFNKNTGAVSTTFAPEVNDVVRTVVAAPDGESVYVGGKFGQIDGEPAYKLARLDIDTGEPVPGFDPGVIDAVVMDARLSGDRLFISGIFLKIDGVTQEFLAELDPDTGALRDGIDLDFEGIAWSGKTQVYKFDVTPDGTRMVILGNFREIDGLSRVQVAMLDLTTNQASVMSWATTKYDHECLRSTVTEFDVRDVDFSPDGDYFVTVATGGATVEDALCDGAARWETNATGPDQEPSWFDLTGGDSVYSVATTGTAVYVGGHFKRWNSSVIGRSGGGPGHVDRNGIAALDPVNGLPLTWNPGRDRGRAVWDLVATTTGLWAGNDTENIGGEYHARIAFFPLSGGTPVPQPSPPDLPVDVHLISPDSNPDQLVRRPNFNGTTAGPASVVAGAGTGWSSIHGGFVADGELYAARDDATLVSYTLNGDQYGQPQVVDLHGMDGFANTLGDFSSLFYENGRIYYTLKDKGALYMRYFSVESEIVGSFRFVVVEDTEGFGLKSLGGAFLADDDVYRVHEKNCTLARLQWVDGEPVSGTSTVVSGPDVDGIDWCSNGLFARPA